VVFSAAATSIVFLREVAGEVAAAFLGCESRRFTA